jgi:hypothetical protein
MAGSGVGAGASSGAGAAGGGAYYAEPEGDINDPAYAGDDPLTREEATFQQSKYYVRPVPSLEELRMLRSHGRTDGRY